MKESIWAAWLRSRSSFAVSPSPMASRTVFPSICRRTAASIASLPLVPAAITWYFSSWIAVSKVCASSDGSAVARSPRNCWKAAALVAGTRRSSGRTWSPQPATKNAASPHTSELTWNRQNCGIIGWKDSRPTRWSTAQPRQPSPHAPMHGARCNLHRRSGSSSTKKTALRPDDFFNRWGSLQQFARSDLRFRDARRTTPSGRAASALAIADDRDRSRCIRSDRGNYPCLSRRAGRDPPEDP